MSCSNLRLMRMAVVCAAVMCGVHSVRWCAHSHADEAAERYTLRYRFTPDQTVDYTVEQESQDFYKRGEAQQQVNYGTTTWKHYRVVSVDDDGNAVLQLQIDRVVMRASEDGGEWTRFDTQDSETAPVQFVGVFKTIGQPMARVRVSPRGEMLPLSGPDVMEWLLEDVPNPGTESLSDMNLLIPLPEEAVAVGQVWKEPFEMQVGVDLTNPLKRTVKLQRQYRIDSVDGSQVSIRFETAVLTPLQEPAQEAQILKKVARGKVLFDMEEGRIISRSTHVDEEVVGFNGPGSEIRNVTNRTEEVRR